MRADIFACPSATQHIGRITNPSSPAEKCEVASKSNRDKDLTSHSDPSRWIFPGHGRSRRAMPGIIGVKGLHNGGSWVVEKRSSLCFVAFCAKVGRAFRKIFQESCQGTIFRVPISPQR